MVNIFLIMLGQMHITDMDLSYYPKLQSAIPFTPVTGDRIFINKEVKNKKIKLKKLLITL